MSHLEQGLDGVILAAGRGTRMQPFSHHYPKPLLPILNEPLIYHQIRYLASIGCRRVIVVIGHLGGEIAVDLGRGTALGVDLEYVEQRDSLGIAHAVMQLEPHLDRPFALLLGDIFFEANPALHVIEWMRDRRADGFLSVAHESNPEAIRRNFAVHHDDEGTVRRVIEKPRFPRTDWKGTGLYVFDVSFFDAIRRAPRTAGRNEYELTDAIQIYIDDGATVLAGPALAWDINLTFPYDLLRANLHALRQRNTQNVIAPDARIHDGAVLDECVVGPGVVINAPASIRRSLLMKNAVLASSEPLDRVVLTSDRLVNCRYEINED